MCTGNEGSARGLPVSESNDTYSYSLEISEMPIITLSAWKLIKGNLTKMESGAQKGDPSQRYHGGINTDSQQKETYLASPAGSDVSFP